MQSINVQIFTNINRPVLKNENAAPRTAVIACC